MNTEKVKLSVVVTTPFSVRIWRCIALASTSYQKCYCRNSIKTSGEFNTADNLDFSERLSQVMKLGVPCMILDVKVAIVTDSHVVLAGLLEREGHVGNIFCLHHKFVPEGTTINKELHYCLCEAVHVKLPELLAKTGAPARHTSLPRYICSCLCSINLPTWYCVVLPHPLYSSCNFYLFQWMDWLKSCHFKNATDFQWLFRLQFR
jgi:hypothetical protein